MNISLKKELPRKNDVYYVSINVQENKTFIVHKMQKFYSIYYTFTFPTVSCTKNLFIQVSIKSGNK